MTTLDYDVWDAVLQNIYEKTLGDNWFKPADDSASTGVAVRIAPGALRLFPYENASLVTFEAAVRALNPAAAVKYRSTCVHVVLDRIADDEVSISVAPNTRIQILDSMHDLPQAEKDQCAAFIRDEKCLVLWSFNVDTIIEMCHELEEKLIRYVWRTRPQSRPVTLDSYKNSIVSSPVGNQLSSFDEKRSATVSNSENEKASASPSPTPKKNSWWTWKLRPSSSLDPEKGASNERKLMLFDPFYSGLGAGLASYFAVSGASILLEEYALDGELIRFGLVLTLPIILCISVFFCLQLIGNVALIIGPVNQYHENSKYYSAIKPEPNDVDHNLPHITIQLPVYKESLDLVIAPSVYSIKKAMQTYARQGGTSSIFICDDGLRLLDEEEKQERISFYSNHNIGWIARPGHGKEGFIRPGRFKKASNMNYGLALSLKLEKFLQELEAKGEPEDETESLEDKAMNLAIEEIFQETEQRWKPWAANPKSLRMGEIILIIDADTVVPEDCFRDAAREMYAAPDVAIIQHESGVLQVAHHYFENGITHFTRRINKAISLGCANGAVAPFISITISANRSNPHNPLRHNAFLRWSAVQDASFVEDGVRKQWSEANVSEDFNIALRLLQKGYNLRWATYSDGGFKEGVSLTIVDELARWQKYAYGNEIIFNPMVTWWRKGPIAQELRGFVWSPSAPIHYKIGMMAYMFSYYGIAAAMLGSILNYLLLGMAPQIDQFYLHSFEILLACVVVFPGLGNVGFILLEYRLGHRSLFNSIYENIRWVPFFFFFFGGLAIHLSMAILAHMFSYNMTWGSTGKEVERSSFWIEVPRIWKRFKVSYIICLLSIAMVVVMQMKFIPLEWRINGYEYALIIPLALVTGSHLLLPIVLNPWLMVFSY